MPGGYLGTVGSTADFTLTRDQLIEEAFKSAGLWAEGEGLTPEQLNVGIVKLSLIVREVDHSGNWVWTVQQPSHLALEAGVGVYDVQNGLPNNISEIVSAVYRAKDGRDSSPLKILKSDGYEAIQDKLGHGEPHAVYLTTDTRLEQRRLYVSPYLSSVTAQSQVEGTDGNIYKCIYPHTASATNKPVDGANWRMVWELSAGATTTWALGTAYTAAEAIRLVIKRPIFDFASASTTPDFPISWPRLLVTRLAIDVGQVYRIPQGQMEMLAAMLKGSFTDIFPSTRPKSNDIHNKVQFF